MHPRQVNPGWRAGRLAATCAMLALTAMVLIGGALAGCATTTRDRTVARRDQFEAVLARQDSATRALEEWCATRQLAQPPEIMATVLPGMAATTPEPAGLHKLLGLPRGTAPGYRHVRLSCGGIVLSEAYNWYVAERLTPAMNATLAQTRTPFGKVAAPLGFRRERLDARHGAASGCPHGTVLSHRALLRLPDRTPLALVIECYTSANLR